MSENTFKPLVSIIIPVYNGSNYLARAIDSALKQDYDNIEIIVVNDGSKDDGKTEQVALSYGAKISYYSKENGGVASALNFGISKMKGEYFSWLSHDDEYAPNKVSCQVNALGSQENKELVCLCETKQIDTDSNILTDKGKGYFKKGGVYPWQVMLLKLYSESVFNGCALLIPKVAFEKAGVFDVRFRVSQDLLMWTMILINKFDFLYLKEKAVLYRVHNEQGTQTMRSSFYTDSLEMSKELAPLLCEISTKKFNYLYAYAKYSAKYNYQEVVKKIIALAKTKKLFCLGKRIKIKFICLYGKIRPAIRRIYYKLFKKVTTQ